jgi:hypothetical protein
LAFPIFRCCAPAYRTAQRKLLFKRFHNLKNKSPGVQEGIARRDQFRKSNGCIHNRHAKEMFLLAVFAALFDPLRFRLRGRPNGTLASG